MRNTKPTPVPSIPAVPDYWEVRRNKTFMREVNRPSLDGEGEMLSVSHITGVTPRSEKTVYMFEAESTVGYKQVMPGDLVINTMWAWMGAAGVARTAGIVSPAYGVYEIDASVVDPEWIDALVRTRAYVSEMTRFSRGVTSSRLRLYPDDFLRLTSPVPPLREQRLLIDHIRGETARIDSLVAAKRRMIDLLDARFESAVFWAVTIGLDRRVPLKASGLAWVEEIPHHWTTPTVSANFELQLGKMLNADAAEGAEQYPYVRNINVQWDRVVLEDLATMHFDEVDRRRCELRPGDVLVCEGGEVGRAAVWQGERDDVFFQKAIHRVRPRNGSNSRYLMYCLRAAAKRSVFAVQGNLSTIVHLTGEQLRVHRFPWPPAAEQSDIVGHLDALALSTAKVRDAVQRQIDLLVEQRQALVTAAVTGEVELVGVAA